MRKKKRLQELTIKDNFMFGAVMAYEDMCRQLLEMVLEFPIERVEVSKEHSLIYHPEHKGVRLDVYARDENHTHYNVEMQVGKDASLPRRSRYYHSQIDMELLLSGASYPELPDSYVIFICDYDPCGKEKYKYTFRNCCEEVSSLALEDGSCTIYLSTCGKNDREVSEELVKFLRYVKADLAGSTADFEDEFVRRLQEAVRKVKESREMEERYMLLEELLKTERNEGRLEGLAEGKAEGLAEGKLEGMAVGKLKGKLETVLEDFGALPAELSSRIESETDMGILESWLKAAREAESMEEFIEGVRQ